MADQSLKRRKFQRTPTELTASIEQIDNILSASVLNISQGGLFIRCANPPAEWQDLDISIRLPNKKVIKARGVVVWRLTSKHANPGMNIFPGAGIQFLEIADDDMQLIAEAVGKPI
jgi:hypothetical protein